MDSERPSSEIGAAVAALEKARWCMYLGGSIDISRPINARFYAVTVAKGHAGVKVEAAIVM